MKIQQHTQTTMCRLNKCVHMCMNVGNLIKEQKLLIENNREETEKCFIKLVNPNYICIACKFTLNIKNNEIKIVP